MATPVGVPFVGGYSYKIGSIFDLNKPQRDADLYRRYGTQGMPLYHVLRKLGFEKPIAGEKIIHNEENKILATIHNYTNDAVDIVYDATKQSVSGKNAVVGAWAGTTTPVNGDMVIQLSPTLDVEVSDLNYAIYARKNDVVQFPNGGEGLIIDIDRSSGTNVVRVLIRPKKIASDFGTISDGQALIIPSNAFGEKSNQPLGRASGMSVVENYIQIFKETIDTSGTNMTDEMWITSMNGIALPAAYVKGQQDMELRLAAWIDGALTAGESTDNTTLVDPDSGEQIYSTQGIFPTAKAGGHTKTYTPNNYQITDFDDYDYTLGREWVATKNILCLLGIRLHQELENRLITFLKQTDVSYANKQMANEFFGGDEQMSVMFNFTHLLKGGRHFMFKRMDGWNNPEIFGATGYNYNQKGVLIPLDKSKDAKTGEMLDSFGVRYKEHNGYSRKLEIWEVGGAGNGLKVTGKDNREFYMRAHLGAQIKGANRMIVVEPI